MSSIKEVALLARTSTATVSRVINETGFVSDEIRMRVLSAISELDYRPLERKGAKAKTKTIALVTPDIENPFFGKMVKSISKIANELKYNVLLINVGGLKNDGGDYLLSLIASRVDGVLYASSYRLHDVIEKAKNSHIPLVILDREFTDIEIDSVAVNNNQAGHIATDHLIQLGHRQIGFIGGNPDMEISRNRYEGYKRALNDNDLPINESYLHSGDFSLSAGYDGAKALLENHPKVTAIVAANDLMAIGAINYANFKGLKVPKDFSVVGFDDIELASAITPSLTTVAYPLERMSEVAVHSIINQLADKDALHESVTLFPQLVIRHSSGPLSSNTTIKESIGGPK